MQHSSNTQTASGAIYILWLRIVNLQGGAARMPQSANTKTASDVMYIWRLRMFMHGNITKHPLQSSTCRVGQHACSI
jgi:hypothetical protein